ncbi:phosphopantetheine-binding protein [Streptomyces amakusaensis]|uniref:Phosphopantetheine-binding protein n=1 Tax=Streptomyces amakusaensis TaxID=67271 RepID=A0ABW0ASY5_9ACTN
MAGADGAGELLRARGIPLMAPETALEGLRAALEREETATAFAAVDWDRFAPAFSVSRSGALLDDLPDARRAARTGAGPARADALRERLAGLPADEQSRILLELVRTHAADALGHRTPDGVRATTAFKDLGFDSMASLTLRNRLNEATGLTLATTVVFDHATAAALAGQLRAELLPDGGTAGTALADLDRLEAAVDSTAPGDQTRTRVVARLRTLLWKWDQPDEAPGGDALTSASDDEIFDILNKELGIS